MARDGPFEFLGSRFPLISKKLKVSRMKKKDGQYADLLEIQSILKQPPELSVKRNSQN